MSMSSEPKLPLLHSRVSIAEALIQGLQSVHIPSSWGNEQQKQRVHQAYGEKVRRSIHLLSKVSGISGRLPSQIQSITVYALSRIAPIESDQELEEIIFAATRKVMESIADPLELEEYFDWYRKEKTKVATEVAQSFQGRIAGVIADTKENQ